jgi:hypothetical protein
MHNEALSVIPVRICNPIVRPLESIAETQPQLHPALLRLSHWVMHLNDLQSDLGSNTLGP